MSNKQQQFLPVGTLLQDMGNNSIWLILESNSYGSYSMIRIRLKPHFPWHLGIEFGYIHESSVARADSVILFKPLV